MSTIDEIDFNVEDKVIEDDDKLKVIYIVRVGEDTEGISCSISFVLRMLIMCGLKNGERNRPAIADTCNPKNNITKPFWN